MAQMTNYLEVALRKHLFRTGSYAKPTDLLISLHTGSIQEDGTGTEVSGGSYARQSLPPLDANWTAASATDGLTDNASAIVFPVATADWGDVVDVGIWDESGNMLCYGTLTLHKVVNSGDQFTLPIGALDVVFG